MVVEEEAKLVVRVTCILCRIDKENDNTKVLSIVNLQFHYQSSIVI